MSDDGGPATMAEGDNHQVAAEEQDVVKRIRHCYNVPQGSVARSADIHKMKLIIVACACATKNISTIEKAPEECRACVHNFKELLGKLKSANMVSVAIETELRKPIKGCNKAALVAKAIEEIPGCPHGATLWTKWGVIKSKLMNEILQNCIDKDNSEEKLGSGKGLTDMWNLVMVKIYMDSAAHVSFVHLCLSCVALDV
jgi:hypothetical protein